MSVRTPQDTKATDGVDGEAIRPFRVDTPEEDLDDLRQRIAATQWPERETVPDATQGVQLATIQAVALRCAEGIWERRRFLA